MDDPFVISAEDLAVMLGISIDLVYDGCRRGQIPHRRIGRRVIFSRAAIEQWLTAA